MKIQNIALSLLFFSCLFIGNSYALGQESAVVLLEPMLSAEQFKEMQSEGPIDKPNWLKDDPNQISREQGLDNLVQYILKFGLPTSIVAEEWSPDELKNLVRLFAKTTTNFGDRLGLKSLSYKVDLRIALDALLTSSGEIIIDDPWGHYAVGYKNTLAVSASGRVYEIFDTYNND